MGEKNQKIQDYKKNHIDIDSRYSRHDAKSFAILATNKVGSFL